MILDVAYGQIKRDANVDIHKPIKKPQRKTRLLSLVLLVLLCLALTPSAGAASMWSQTYGDDTLNEVAFSLKATPDNGYALAGSQLLVKTDADGNMQWNRTYPDGVIYSLAVASDGGYAIAGTDFSDPQYRNFWLIKTDSYGNSQWNKTYHSTAADDVAYLVVATSDGGYAVGGFSISEEYSCFWLVKADNLGNMQWNKTYPSPNVNSIVQTADGGYALAGATNPVDSNLDFWLAKTDADGNLQWNYTYGGAGYDMANSLVQTTDGGYVLAGKKDYQQIILANQKATSTPTEPGGSDIWLVKTDADGIMQWNKTCGEGEAYSLVAASDGGYAVAGSTVENQTSWLLKTDALGNTQWKEDHAGNSTHSVGFMSLVAASDGGYAIAGYIYNTLDEKFDFWLAKTNEFGVIPQHLTIVTISLFFAITVPFLLGKKKLLSKHH